MYYPGGYNQTNLTYDNTANWKDQAVTINGENITYDTVGNPLVYRGANLTWENGRQLKSYTEDGQTISFGYDAEGKRTRKTLPNGVYYEYIYSDGVLTNVKSSDFGVNFTYITDESGNYIGFKNYNTMYYFVRNLQNDVVAITDANGTVIVTYEYDPWGVPTIIADEANYMLGYSNMIRYRGYFYDVETGLYYLQSRYYDPSTGRFINADGYASTGQGVIGANAYAYCLNNPVMYSDPTGRTPALFMTLGAALVNVCALIFTALAISMLVDVLIDVYVDSQPMLPAFDWSKSNEKINTDSKAEEKELQAPKSPPIYIYRYGGINPGNLTPKSKDLLSGLSFSTIPMPGAAKTTIEDLNATGVVYAVKDGLTHVSVRPIGGTMSDWINEGSSSIWTQAVKSAVVKWDGVS